ncbi:MAG: hypothetical protein IJ747_02140 [Lachnospiraceae bacterium]|nr:hypothetical protein [Lachnospiraceae bacterium]
MSALLIKILNSGINATWLILAVVILRLALKKAPKWIFGILWALVAVRLVCPVSLESVFSLLPSGEVVPANIEMQPRPEINSGVTVINRAVNPVLSDTFAPAQGSSVNPLQVVLAVAAIVWIVGMMSMLLYAVLSFLLLRRTVRASVPVGERVMACDEVKTPFILGVIRPVVYVPSTLSGETYEMVIAHEMAHIRRRDHWWKPLGFFLLAVYWFHPACWLAYILFCRDIEAACDEKVIKDRDRAYMAAYSQALLDLSVPRRSIAACPLAFGEAGVKERVKGVLHYKKPAFWVIIAAILVCGVVAVCFLTNPAKDQTASAAEGGIAPQADREVQAAMEAAQNAQKKEQAEMQRLAEMQRSAEIQKSRPVVNLAGPEGADMTQLLYADESRIIFSGYYGLFAYSKPDHAIVAALDLAAIGCNDTQGDNYCEKFVSADGKIVYLHPISDTEMYVYDIAADTLTKTAYTINTLDGVKLHVLPQTMEEKQYDVWNGDGRLMETYLHHGSMLGDLGYIDCGATSEDTVLQYYPLFSPDGYAGAVNLAPTDIQGIVSAAIWRDGVLRQTEDADILRQLEEILSGANMIKGTSACPFYTALYLQKSDGTVGWIFPATDSCSMFLSGKACYQFLETSYEFSGKKTNDALWNLIDQFEETEHAPTVADWMQVDLPEGYAIGAFAEDIGWMGGALILPQSYQVQAASSAPMEWQYSGLISRIPAESAEVTFTNGIPDVSSHLPLDNHSAGTNLAVIGLERSNTQWSAILRSANHDLYTVAEIGELEAAGQNVSILEPTSDYWEFWFVKEGEDTYYILTLSAKEFSQEEAERIAKTVFIRN